MGQPRVLVSSTAYDLSVIRSTLRKFITDHGFEPVLSEFSDILYDFRQHTHQNCIDDVKNCDMLVLVIGGRLGSLLNDEVLQLLVTEMEPATLSNATLISNISITQAEAITAASAGIPVFAFVDSGVYHDYQLFKNNRDQAFVSQINFVNITRPGTAQYIFGFIDFLENRHTNNALVPFDKIDDITTHLQRQWAALFQRLLAESRTNHNDATQIDRLVNQFEDLKAALLTTIGIERRQVARAAVRFRRLVTFLGALPADAMAVRSAVVEGVLPWDGLLAEAAGVTIIEPVRGAGQWRSTIYRGSDAAYRCKLPVASIHELAVQWKDLLNLDVTTREAVFEELMGGLEESDDSLMAPAPSLAVDGTNSPAGAEISLDVDDVAPLEELPAVPQSEEG